MSGSTRRIDGLTSDGLISPALPRSALVGLIARRARRLSLAASLAFLVFAWVRPAVAGPPFGYIVTGGSSDPSFACPDPANRCVFVLDMGAGATPDNSGTNTVVAKVAVGPCAFSVAVNPQGTTAYVPDYCQANVRVLDTRTNPPVVTQTLTPSPAGFVPQDVIVNPTMPRAYVTHSWNSGGTLPHGKVSVINTTNNSVLQTLDVGFQPIGVVVNPAGTRLYVVNSCGDDQCVSAGSVSVIDTQTNVITSSVPVGSGANEVAISLNGKRVYVTNSLDGTVSVIDATESPAPPHRIATVGVGSRPEGLGVNRSGSRVYVANRDDYPASVSVIDTSTNTVSTTLVFVDSTGLILSRDASGVAIDPGGTRVYAMTLSDVNLNVGRIAIIDDTTTPPGILPFPNRILVGEFPVAGTQSVSTCGSGMLDPGEQCDHGDKNGFDGCCTTTCEYVSPTDSDGDGLPDVCDNCPMAVNPDQLNSDRGNTVENVGDVCDVCPLDATNSCITALSRGMSIGAAGGTFCTADRCHDSSNNPILPTTDPKGACQLCITIPACGPVPVAAPDPCTWRNGTSFSITQEIGGSTTVGTVQNAAFPSVLFGPQTTPRLTFPPYCSGGSEAGKACGRCFDGTAFTTACRSKLDCPSGSYCKPDSADCAGGGTCVANYAEATFTWAESTLKAGFVNGFSGTDPDGAGPLPKENSLSEGSTFVFQDGTAATQTCQNSTTSPACLTACSGRECCCNPAANTWKTQLDHLSEYVLGDATAIDIPGGGDEATDCLVEWVVLDPEEMPPLDGRGLLTTRHTCVDGDPRCDQDGVVNGSCSFAVGACLNVLDDRLQPACSPSDVARVTILRPTPADHVADRAAAGTAVRDLFAGLADSVIGGDAQEKVTYLPPVATSPSCTAVGTVTVPLNGRRRGVRSLSIKAESSSGTEDRDRLRLRCLQAR